VLEGQAIRQEQLFFDYYIEKLHRRVKLRIYVSSVETLPLNWLLYRSA
jgi:hypothetical protein